MKDYLIARIRSLFRPSASVFLWLGQRVTLGTQIVLLSGKGVLLVRHRYKAGWHLPGEGISRDEDLSQGIKRQLQEQTGYKLIGEPALLGLYPSSSKGWVGNYVAVFYSIYFDEPSSHAETSEISDCQWFPVSDLPPGSTTFCRAMIYVVSKSVGSAQWRQLSPTGLDS